MTMNEFLEKEFEPIPKELCDEICDDCGSYGLHSSYDCEKNQEKLADITD
jgi:hypothetical protein